MTRESGNGDDTGPEWVGLGPKDFVPTLISLQSRIGGEKACAFFGGATMATMLKCAADYLRSRLVSGTGLGHHVAIPAPLGKVMDCINGPQFPLPESNIGSQEIELPCPDFSGSMELMAVPKKKVSRHKRGIRNGPRALKPIPVIIKCKSCGRVKLPHFFCCSGDRGASGGGN